MTLEKLKDASCSDGDCVFKITPEMKKGMRTNGGCSCLKDMRHGIGSRKTYAVMVLSQIASDAEAALKEKDARIKKLEEKLSDSFAKDELRMIGTALSYIIHNRYLPNGHDAYEERALLHRVEKMFDSKALEARDATKHIVEPSPLTPEELAEYERECREEARDE